MPRPGTPVIPAGWAAHHRPVSTGADTATCSLTRPGGTGKTFDASTGTMNDTPNTPYLTGAACRVEDPSSAGATQLFGDQLASTLSFVVVIDWAAGGAADVHVDDVVELTANPQGDPNLIGRPLRVAGVARSSVAWDRVVGVIDNQG